MLAKVLKDSRAREDIFLAIVVLGFSALIYVRASSLPPPLFDPLGSAAIPKLVAGILAFLSLAIIGAAVLRNLGEADEAISPSDAEVAPPPLRPGVAFASILIIVAYVGSMALGILGFRVATILFVIALGGVMSRFQVRTMIILTVTALIIGIGFAWLFSEILYVDLPQTGIFGVN